MRLPNSFTDGTCIGIVVGGDINDPASDHSGGMRIFIPGLHGKDVDVRHLAFSSMQKIATNSSQQSFEGVLDPGSVVYVRKDTGSNMCHILGTANEIYDPNSTVSGNFNLLSLPQIQQAIQKTINIRIPPQIQETIQNGVRVRIPQEKNQLHRHALLSGIPANGAVYPLAGSIVPNITNVPTAIQAFASVLTPALAALLPGLNVSLGSLLTSLLTGSLTGSLKTGQTIHITETSNANVSIANTTTSTANTLPGEIVGPTGVEATRMITDAEMREHSRELMSKFTPQMKTTFTSMSTMMASIETTTGSGFVSGGRVDPTTYMTNAVSLLGQCKGIGDMVSCMQQLQYDNSLFGTDKLASITMNISTPFGMIPLSISATGAISQVLNNPVVSAAINTFISQISSAIGFPGVVPTQNMFGSSAGTMFDLFQRLSPQALSTSIVLSTKLNLSPMAISFAATNRMTNMGGNPFLTLFL